MASIAAANYLTSRYALVGVGFGLTATAGSYAAGFSLLARDAVQATLGKFWALVGILAGAGITALVSPSLAVASATSFLVSELADMGVYTPLRSRGWLVAAIASNCVGAVIDTMLFLYLARFPFTYLGLAGQLVAKAVWSTVLLAGIGGGMWMMRRVVSVHSIKP
ncbi:VUT family protein [Streptomyces violaceusniger]|uniref:VUT family protein n=1 Tax=Streptomyces violaceusniger TaxID=68280 RepID=UPI00380B999D